MFKIVLQGLFARKLRLVTTALAVTLGVAFTAGTLVLTDTMSHIFDDLSAGVYKGTDAVVRAKAVFNDSMGGGEQRPLIDASLVPALSHVPGVAAAEGSAFGYTRLIGKDGTPIGNPGNGAPTLGGNWSTVQTLNPFHLVAGHAPQSPDEVVIDKQSAQLGHLAVGDTATVLVTGPPQRVRISGIVAFGTADSPAGASVVLFTTPVAQRLVAAPGKFSSISFVADPGVSQQQLVSNLQRALPPGTEAVTGAAVVKETQDSFQKILSVFSKFFLIFAVVALLVGGFIIMNTFAITVAQRTRENGLLRALGASAPLPPGQGGDRHAGAGEHHAQPQAHRGQRLRADDRGRPGRVHHHLCLLHHGIDQREHRPIVRRGLRDQLRRRHGGRRRPRAGPEAEHAPAGGRGHR